MNSTEHVCVINDHRRRSDAQLMESIDSVKYVTLNMAFMYLEMTRHSHVQ